MAVHEIEEAFDEHFKNVPTRFIDLHATPICFIERDAVKQRYKADIESVSEEDIVQHTSYANQRREDVIRTIVRGIVKYAVLSHTWRSEDGAEFTYQQMASPQHVRDGTGWSKLERFTSIARDLFKCQFAWADTVCIDPDTPSDRQAGARSGFDWFRNAHVCIVYLASARSLSELEHDRWFRRGWPLRELLAPIRMKFYGAGWEPLNEKCAGAENDKADDNFLAMLSKASGISVYDLHTFMPGPNRVREKLAWAARRQTREPEDMAYCLISIFASHMRIDLNEGNKAFLRLMVDVIPKSHECDVFAWAGQSADDHPAIPSSPACYAKELYDHEFHPDPYRYRQCGDPYFSLDYDHLRIKVIFVDVVFERTWRSGYAMTIDPHLHKGSINKVKLLSKALEGTRMVMAIIDYDWTDEKEKGELRKERCYFGFLVQRSSEGARWEKLDTDKVVFLDSKETKRHELRPLHLLC